MNAATALWGRCVICERRQMKNNSFKRFRCPVRVWDTVTSQRTTRGLCASAVDLVYTANSCVPWARQWSSHGAVAATLLRFYCMLFRTQSHDAYFVHVKSARRRMTFYNVPGDPITTNEDAVALSRFCRSLYCVNFGVLHFFKDAAGSIQGRSSGVIGVLRTFKLKS